MVVTNSQISEKSTKMPSVIIRRNYTVEKRIFKDSKWYNGWFRGMVPEWSEWEAVYSYTKASFAGAMYKQLEKDKHHQKCRTEYRFIREPIKNTDVKEE